MALTLIVTISAILSIIFGIIILIFPRALNISVAVYLILQGAVQIIGPSLTL